MGIHLVIYRVESGEISQTAYFFHSVLQCNNFNIVISLTFWCNEHEECIIPNAINSENAILKLSQSSE